ncbi:hypothetical protein RND71_018801 [Anisodus tanguticus]|uniref:Mini-chromosome maintenance complex-binding protein n=1 Tax=Anisodus tanguticus TaxID=243964 RepID=A0AAE1S597_9SOLA|nr:hypothetical protein RND71_018801 [Anisodus tanguticus]
MVGLPYDCLANPLGAVRLTFEKAVACGSDPSTFDGRTGAPLIFSSSSFLTMVPFLNPSNMPWVQPNTLVRFRGMIQDMLGNEFYVGAYKDGETWRTNKFADFSQFPMATGSSPDVSVWERRLLYCVPVPWQNSWIEHSSEALVNPSSISSSLQSVKRHREDDQAMNDIDMQVTNEEVHASTSNKKMREDGITFNSSNPGDTTSVLPNFDRTSFPCLVKIYDSPESDLKLNDVFEFIGVYTFDPEFPVDKNDNNDLESSLCDDTLTQMPPSKVLFLKCFLCVEAFFSHMDWNITVLEFTPFYSTYNDIDQGTVFFCAIEATAFAPDTCIYFHHRGNRCTLRGFSVSGTSTPLPCSQEACHSRLYFRGRIGGGFYDSMQEIMPAGFLKSHLVKATREALLGHLTTILGNDGVHARVDSIAVGKLSLNLTCFNKETVSVFGHRLNLALKNLLPFTHSIPLTVDYLNKVSLAPKRIIKLTGILQLAEGSHLTIDETQLLEGTLNPTGAQNARVLRSLLELQKVEYDFTYYKMDMPTDIQLLILSEGKSNILPGDLVLPFRPSSVDAVQDAETQVLQSWRWYLATMRSLSHSIEQEIQKVVEDDLVAARQADRSLSSLDFSRLLTMGRLVSLSFGETSLTLEHWQMAKELERLRKERLQGSS